MRGTLTTVLLTFTNVFRTVARYGHLCSKAHPMRSGLFLVAAVWLVFRK